MYKQHLLNSIIKEMKICRRLYTKISPEKMDFKPKEETRSILELLQYLTFIGTTMPRFWLNERDVDFTTFFTKMTNAAKELSHEKFLPVMNEQIEKTNDLFNQISEEDLFHKEVTYPWAGKAPLGEAIIETSIKWLSAYKLQLFFYIKLSSDQKLGTADAWVLTEID